MLSTSEDNLSGFWLIGKHQGIVNIFSCTIYTHQQPAASSVGMVVINAPLRIHSNKHR